MKKTLVAVISVCLMALPSAWAGKRGTARGILPGGCVKVNPVSILDAQLSAVELQQAMENVQRLGRRESPHSADSTLRFSAVESPLHAPHREVGLATKVRLRVIPLHELKTVKLPWTGPVPPNSVTREFRVLEIRLAQKGSRWVKATVVPEYYPHFRSPNSPVYLGQATIESLGVSRALAKALPVGGNWRILFRPLLQNAVRLAAKLAARTI